MRGAFLIMMLIALLIVGILVVKNLTSDTVGDVEKVEAVQKAKEISREADRQTQEMKDRLNQALSGAE